MWGLAKRSSAEQLDREKTARVWRGLERDFGKAIRFRSCEREAADFDPYRCFGKRKETWDSAWKDVDIALFAPEEGGPVLGLIVDVPTFDSGDREYDSWHALYLVPGARRGTVDGIYCTGGYRVAYAVRCRELCHAPLELWQLLKKAGLSG